MVLYNWLLTNLGKKVDGVIYNVARALRFKDDSKQRLEDRFARFYLHHNEIEKATVAREALLTRQRASLIHTRAEAERNTGDHCNWRCEFTESCLAGRKGVDEDEFMRAKGFTKGR